MSSFASKADTKRFMDYQVQQKQIAHQGLNTNQGPQNQLPQQNSDIECVFAARVQPKLKKLQNSNKPNLAASQARFMDPVLRETSIPRTRKGLVSKQASPECTKHSQRGEYLQVGLGVLNLPDKHGNYTYTKQAVNNNQGSQNKEFKFIQFGGPRQYKYISNCDIQQNQQDQSDRYHRQYPQSQSSKRLLKHKTHQVHSQPKNMIIMEGLSDNEEYLPQQIEQNTQYGQRGNVSSSRKMSATERQRRTIAQKLLIRNGLIPQLKESNQKYVYDTDQHMIQYKQPCLTSTVSKNSKVQEIILLPPPMPERQIYTRNTSLHHKSQTVFGAFAASPSDNNIYQQMYSSSQSLTQKEECESFRQTGEQQLPQSMLNLKLYAQSSEEYLTQQQVSNGHDQYLVIQEDASAEEQPLSPSIYPQQRITSSYNQSPLLKLEDDTQRTQQQAQKLKLLERIKSSKLYLKSQNGGSRNSVTATTVVNDSNRSNGKLSRVIQSPNSITTVQLEQQANTVKKRVGKQTGNVQMRSPIIQHPQKSITLSKRSIPSLTIPESESSFPMKCSETARVTESKKLFLHAL